MHAVVSDLTAIPFFPFFKWQNYFIDPSPWGAKSNNRQLHQLIMLRELCQSPQRCNFSPTLWVEIFKAFSSFSSEASPFFINTSGNNLHIPNHFHWRWKSGESAPSFFSFFFLIDSAPSIRRWRCRSYKLRVGFTGRWHGWPACKALCRITNKERKVLIRSWREQGWGRGTH